MKPINSGGHAAYQDHVLNLMRKYYPDPDAIPASAWTIIDRFWHLDLSHVDEQMADRYSLFGPAPRLPSCMLRSVLLSIEFRVTSFTEWSRQLIIYSYPGSLPQDPAGRFLQTHRSALTAFF